MSSAPTSDSRTARTFFLASGRILSALLGVAGLAILSRLLETAEYATYQQVLQLHALAAPLLLFGFPETLNYFLPRSTQKRSAVLENLALPLSAGLAFAGCLLLGGHQWLAGRTENPGPGLATALRWLGPLALFSLPAESAGPVLLVAGRAQRYALFLTAARIVALTGTVAAVLLWRPTGAAAVTGTAIATVISGTVALWLAVTAFAGGGNGFRRAGVVEQLRYALPLGIGSVVAGWLFTYDKIIVGRICTPEEFALYVNGAWEIPLVGILAGSATAVLWPEMTRLFQEHQTGEMLALWRRSTVKSACVGFPLFLFGMALADETITVIYSARYTESAAVFRVYLLLILARVAAWTVVPQAANQSGKVLGVTITGLVAMLAASPWCVARFGPIGAAWALVGVTGLILVPGYGLLTARVLETPWWSTVPWRGLARTMALSALPGVVLSVKLMPALPPLVVLTLSAAIYFPACYLLLTRLGDCPRVELVERWLKKG